VTGSQSNTATLAVYPWRKVRPDLAGTEHSGERGRAEAILEELRVVISRTEEVLAASVAGEQQRGAPFDISEQRGEIRVCGFAVAYMELDCLADLDEFADRQRTGRFVGSDEVPHEEVTPSEVGCMLVDDDADV
jgi:hypothetical protein